MSGSTFVDMTRACAPIAVPGPLSHDSARVGPAYAPFAVDAPEPGLRLDGKEAPVAVLEVVDPQDHDLVRMRQGSNLLALGRGDGAVLRAQGRLRSAIRSRQIAGPSMVAPMS